MLWRNNSGHTLWSGDAADSNWTEVVFDISDIADRESQVWIRWRLISGSVITNRGFYIDDVAICGDTFGGIPPTPSPTATPEDVFYSRLELNQSHFHPGDSFSLSLFASNGTANHLSLDQYVILDVFGQHYFYPGWSLEVDSVVQEFAPGQSIEESILEFIWPDPGSTSDGLLFWLGYCNHETTDLIGDVSWVEFGWGPK